MAPRKVGKRRVGAKKVWKSKAGRKQFLVNRALHPIPQRFITKQKYTTSATLTSANGYTYLMNLNSVFDPDRTGIGHQPYGFDQLAAMYNRYRVINCAYVVNCYANSPSTTLTPIRVAAFPSNEVETIITSSDVMESPRCRWVVQPPGAASKTLKGNVYIPSLVGRSKNQYMADDRYQSLVTQSPAELAVLHLIGSTLGDAAADIVLSITLTYTIEYFDLKKFSQS